MLDRVIGNHGRILQRGDQQPRRDRLARPQRMVLVVEHRLEADRAACGVDLIVDHRQCAFRQRLLAVRRQRDHLQRLRRLRFVDGGQLVFRRGEDHGDRLDLRDRHDAGLRGGIDDVADIDLAQAGDARDRRLDRGVIDLGLGVGDRGVVGRDLRGQLRHGGALGVGLLAGCEFAELGEALQIEIGVGEAGLVLRLLGLGLIERGLDRGGVDLDQHVALLDLLAFLEGDLVDLAVDPGAHQHGIESLHGAEPGEIDRKIGFHDRRDRDGNGGGLRSVAGFCALSALRGFDGVRSLPAEIPRRRQAQRSAKSSGWSATSSWEPICSQKVQWVRNGSHSQTI